MLRRRYEILLPLRFNDGSLIGDDKFDETREELLSRFEGVSWSLHPTQGAWMHEGKRYEDAPVKITVDVDDTPENRQFFKEIKMVLLERFAQLEIYIATHLIEII